MVVEEGRWLKTPWPLCFLLAGLGVAWTVLFGNPLRTLDDRWFDWSLRTRLARGWAPPVDRRIVHLNLTSPDLASLPTAESEYDTARRAILEATELGAELIILDVIYSRGSRQIAEPILEAIRQSRGVVLAEGFPTLPEPALHEERIRSFPFLEVPYEPAGLINIRADDDGVFRRYQFLYKTPQGTQPALALAAYLALRGVRWSQGITVEGDTIRWEELSADGTRMVSETLTYAPFRRTPLLDFRSGWTASGPEAFPHLTLAQLHELHRADRDTGGPRPLEGKILLFSYVVSGVSDFGTTPFGPHQPLVHLHATALNDLLQGTGHHRVPRGVEALFLASVLLLGLGATRVRTTRGLVILWLTGIAATTAAGMALAVRASWVLPTVSVVTLWTLALVVELGRRHAHELMERVRLQSVMGYYFSPRVLKRVLANPGSMEPQRAELTVLLTDLRNFTTLSERLGTRGIFDLCNRLFEVQTKAVMDEDGSLDHFSGDQFLSYWGAPDPHPDAADRAMRASMSLIRAMEEVRRGLAPEVQLLFGYGVAFHSGIALVGNIGSQRRMDYGLIGDLINSAARVESLTKLYGIPFLLTREAYNQLSHPPPCRWVDSVLPVGKSTPLDLLEVEHPLSGEGFADRAKLYGQAFGQYQQGRFEVARNGFRDVAERFKDRPSAVLAERCEQYLTAPPEPWTGVCKLMRK